MPRSWARWIRAIDSRSSAPDQPKLVPSGRCHMPAIGKAPMPISDTRNPVALRWDDWGIPHIRAERRRDLFVGLGYATAQECLWRLEHCRRLARGELAAVLGRGALPSDRTMRLLGLGRHADELARELSEDVAEALDGLAAGINRWIEHAAEARTLPVEFDWLGYAPAPWTPADSIACWKHRWWTLTGRLDNLAAGEA